MRRNFKRDFKIRGLVMTLALAALSLATSAIRLAAAEGTASPAPKKAASEEPKFQPPEFQSVAPHAALQQAAKAIQIPLSGATFDAGERSRIEPGNAVTALVSLIKSDTVQQWAIELAAASPDPAEANAPKKNASRTARFFTTSGYEFLFSSERVPLALRIVGPLEADQAGKKAATAPEVKRARVNVSSDYLTLGLERVPQVNLRARAQRALDPSLPAGNWSMSNRPFPPELVAKSRAGADRMGFTEADERALVGSTLALLEFFQTVSSTPGLQEVLKAVIDVPWWSIIRSGGKMDVGFGSLPSEKPQLDATLWGGLGAGRGVYALPLLLSINGKPALVLQLAVTTPRPPLGVTAGVIGIAARQPDGKGPLLMLQIVAARLGAK